MLNETNLALRFRDRLMGAVNGEISPKAKEHLNTRQYFEKRNAIEDEIIINTSFAPSFFENESTISEIENLNPDIMDSKTLMLCVISALRTYVDNELQDDLKCQALHILYLKLKKELSLIIPFEEGDGFLSYISEKNSRNELLNTRQTGKVCLQCGSHEIASKGAEWQCRDCGHRFRKH
ncbi:MAG: hypothetical protein ABSA75_05720 [Candidatus Bathyarchaeia archaeon]|jgi:hypothetical protein